jgi:DNA-binding transcriptional LysR family regulator
MEFRHLRYFIAIAEAENVSRAASKLRVSQPSLSRQMRDLEASLGVALFRRSPNSLRLTETGRQFLDEAKTILEAVDSARTRIAGHAASSKSHLIVGHVPIIASGMLPELLRSLKAILPQLRIKLREESAASLVENVRECKVDIALSPRPRVRISSDLVYEEMCRYRPGVFVPPGHRLAGKGSIRPKELTGEPLVVPTLKDFTNYHHFLKTVFRFAKSSPKVAMESDTGAGLLVAAASGYGLALMFELPPEAIPGLMFVPLTGGPPPLSFGMLRRRSTQDPNLETFISMARRWADGRNAGRAPPAAGKGRAGSR